MFLFKDILRLMLGSQVKAWCKSKKPNRPEIGTGTQPEIAVSIAVLNKRDLSDPLPGTFRVYVGRPHVLGNPFVLNKDGNRSEVIAKYKRWLWNNLQPNAVDKRVKLALHDLLQKSRTGELELVCWCAPKECHADVLVSAINWLEDLYEANREG